MDEADVARQRLQRLRRAGEGDKWEKQGGTRWTFDVNDLWLGMNSV
jgi:hypothetical protein